MKKIISLIIVFVFSLSLLSCSAKYKGTLLHYEKDSILIQEFFEDVLGSNSDIVSDNFSCSLSFKEEVKRKDTEEESRLVTQVKGFVNYDDGLLIEELKLNGKTQSTYVLPTTDKKVKTTSKTKEKSVFFFVSGNLDMAYVFNKTSVKSKEYSSYLEEKVTDEESSFSYGVFTRYLSLRALINVVEEFLTEYFSESDNHFVYKNGDDLTLVESFDDSNCVIKLYCNGDDLTKITVSQQISPSSSSNEYLTRKFTVAICDDVDIDKPEDRKEYKQDNEIIGDEIL
ncbi:MAG: hypothetical protein IJW64_03370 [Clostridia bacterium]|nr:hypothetical protein [Clostridia bacterium]